LRKEKGQRKKAKQETPMPPRDILERTFEFAVQVVNLCVALGERPGAARRLSGQLLDSGTSIGANVEEAQAGQSRADFISKYSIALKEARETSYWLRLLRTTILKDSQVLPPLLDEAEQLKRILGAIVCRAKDNS
jgi:four helix bundle protein